MGDYNFNSLPDSTLLEDLRNRNKSKLNNSVELSDSTLLKDLRNRNKWKFVSDILYSSKEEAKQEDKLKTPLYKDSEWDDPLVLELKQLVSDYLMVIIKNEIKKLSEFGCDEKTAESLILKSSHIPRGVDFAKGMEQRVLKLLKKPDVIDDSRFDSLDSLVKYTMVEMVCGVKEVNTSFTVAEALWCLIIFDLDVSRACGKNKGQLDGQREILRKRALQLGKRNKRKVGNYSYSIKGEMDILFDINGTSKKSELKDRRDEIKERLESVKVNFQKEVQSWTEWTNGKIKEVTSRRKTVKDEIEEWKKNVKEETNEMMKLEGENVTLRIEMNSVNLNAKEAALILEKAKFREGEAFKNVESSTLDRQLLQSELSGLKRNGDDLNRQFDKVKSRFKQMESVWMKEDDEKEKSVLKAKLIREKMEENEARVGKKVSDMLKRGESEVHVYRERVKELEVKIGGLKCTYKRERDRECVMCLDEEKSVIFLPCAHQVICVKCNVKHEKRGMDCPSCRATINRRIHPRFANS